MIQINCLQCGAPIGALAALVAPPALPLKLVVDGDSIANASASTFPNRWNAEVNQLRGSPVPFSNVGYGGRTLGDPANEDDGGNTLWGNMAMLIAANPSHAFLFIGANDDLGGDYNAYYARLGGYADRLKQRLQGVKIAIGSNTPKSNAYMLAHRIALEDLLRADVQAGTHFDALVPIASNPNFPNGAELTSLFDAGHLHPTNTGVDLLIPIFDAAITPFCADATGTTPDDFAFADRTNADLNTNYSAYVYATGLGPRESVSSGVTGGTAAVGQDALSASPGDMMNGDALTVQFASSAAYSTPAHATGSIGSKSDDFDVTTAAAPAAAVAFVPTARQTTVSNGSQREVPLTLTEAGRPLIGLDVYAGTVGAMVIKDSGGTQVATCNVIQNRTSSYYYGLFVSDTELPAGDYTISLTVGAQSQYCDFYVGYLTNTTSATPTGSSKLDPVATNSGDVKAMPASIPVANGGIGVIYLYAAGGVQNAFGNTLSQSYTGGFYPKAFYTFNTTETPQFQVGQGGMNMYGAAFQ